MNSGGIFANISQRAASSYRKLLAEFGPSGENGNETCSSQNDLHAFFETLYEDLFQNPQSFGLPAGEDQSIADDEPNEKDKKQAVMQRIKKPRSMIIQILDFLILAGVRGQVEGCNLILDDLPTIVKEAGLGPKNIRGLEIAGLAIELKGSHAVLSSPAFPGMFSALKILAVRCMEYESERMGKFHFARCDFRALAKGYDADILELYQVFRPEESAQLSQLHAFFSAKGYKTFLEVGGPFAWVVKYQGNRKIKATPLFQVEYDERCTNPLRMVIKCASTNRIASLLPHQSQFLQDDFINRVYACRGDDCGWCRNQKTLGPALVTYMGKERKVCWFSNGNIHGIDADSLELIQQYALLHDQLLPENN